METRTLPARNCNSQRPPQVPVGKMVARRRKRGERDSEQGIPSPPGYSAIPIKFSEKQQAFHYLYVKEHRVREGTKSSWPQKRTLFVLNVPPYCTESVQLQEKPELADSPKEPKSKFFHPTPIPGFQVAYVVFQKPGGVSAALVLKGPLLVSTESHPVKSGIHKWISNYTDSVPDPEALRVEVDTFMEAYDERIAEEEAKAKEEEGVPDEEGWVKVTRRGRRPVLPRTEAASLRVLERERRKRARKELLNFYAWQHRETKMELAAVGAPGLFRGFRHTWDVGPPPDPEQLVLEPVILPRGPDCRGWISDLAQLRKKFEEDKQRIELMRAQRKFRPY
uniref:Ribosomal RNA-processing protein 7 homolog A isoform X2 n=1 Tax=Callorhinus ursinus TaxID=34884 RepID=A0A3Q7PW10_CALUR|nr:ribosomal RNA-processing protein 7 homolog A isoform X2 [Callorhinus ursinus]XP_025737725.1 ribosomal RNA-processing protein 7 homolog A isoform X2 [Callorhinus ursinus]